MLPWQNPAEFDGVMEGIDAFPAYIYRAKFGFNFDSMKDKIDRYLSCAQKIKEERNLSDPEEGNSTTGVHFNYDTEEGWDVPHNWEEFNELFNFIEMVTPFLLDTWFGVQIPIPMSVGESWINVHRKGGSTSAHHHQNACISIVAYLNVPENSGRFLVDNPLRPYKCSEPLAPGSEDRMWGPIEVESGDILFFPGWLTHKTEKSQTDEPRYVLSANLKTLPVHPAFKQWEYVGRKINTTDQSVDS
tara:strand:- start:85 stop:819 length:735 start_codon:yes stop_codon:yes gene_type:complete